MATYQQWSQSYFDNLTPDQHNMNNDKLLSSSKEWKEIDNIIQQIKGGN